MAYYTPKTEFREISIVPQHAVLLFIDIQNYNCHRGGILYKAHVGQGKQNDPDVQYFYNRIDSILPNMVKLQQHFRSAAIEVMYTVIQSQTRNGRDRSLDYKISGFHVPPNSWDGKMIEDIRPDGDEMVIPKTSSSVFNSTNLDYILRSMDKKFIVMCGAVTDQCVAHAVMDACDLGYYVTLVPECCATYSQARHDAALSAIRGYCRMRSIDQLAAELAAHQQQQQQAAQQQQKV